MRPSDHDHDHDPEFAPPPGVTGSAADRTIGWVGGHARGLLTLAVVFQVGVLLAMVGLAAAPGRRGEPHRALARLPGHPHNLFRGRT